MMYIHPTAEVSDGASLSDGVRVWAYSQIREDAVIGANSQIGSHSYIDAGVAIGADCKIQSGVMLFLGTKMADGVFVGPGAIVTNDLRPRAINPDGSVKAADDWTVGEVHVGRGASLGAGSIVIAGVSVGDFALVGAGSIVTKDVPAHALVVGSPARIRGWVCCCGEPLVVEEYSGSCKKCERVHPISSP